MPRAKESFPSAILGSRAIDPSSMTILIFKTFKIIYRKLLFIHLLGSNQLSCFISLLQTVFYLHFVVLIDLWQQGCAKIQGFVVRANKFCMLSPNICRFSLRNLVLVTLIAAGIFRWFLHFWKICASLYYNNLFADCSFLEFFFVLVLFVSIFICEYIMIILPYIYPTQFCARFSFQFCYYFRFLAAIHSSKKVRSLKGR